MFYDEHFPHYRIFFRNIDVPIVAWSIYSFTIEHHYLYLQIILEHKPIWPFDHFLRINSEKWSSWAEFTNLAKLFLGWSQHDILNSPTWAPRASFSLHLCTHLASCPLFIFTILIHQECDLVHVFLPFSSPRMNCLISVFVIYTHTHIHIHNMLAHTFLSLLPHF